MHSKQHNNLPSPIAKRLVTALGNRCSPRPCDGRHSLDKTDVSPTPVSRQTHTTDATIGTRPLKQKPSRCDPKLDISAGALHDSRQHHQHRLKISLNHTICTLLIINSIENRQNFAKLVTSKPTQHRPTGLPEALPTIIFQINFTNSVKNKFFPETTHYCSLAENFTSNTHKW